MNFEIDHLKTEIRVTSEDHAEPTIAAQDRKILARTDGEIVERAQYMKLIKDKKTKVLRKRIAIKMKKFKLLHPVREN